MSRLQDHERKVRLSVHGVTEIKPQGLLAVRPLQTTHKSKEGVYQSQHKMPASGCTFSTEMVKALKSALMDGSYHAQKELSKKAVCSKSRLQQKSLVKPSQQSKCASSLNKSNACSYSAKKSVTSVGKKMELVAWMNMEGVAPKAADSDLASPVRHRPQKKTDISQSSKTPPTRRGQRESSRRKSLIAVPTSSPERRKTSHNRMPSIHTNGPPVKQHIPSCLEARKLATVSLDRFILGRNKELRSSRPEKIVPDMTTGDFMQKLMSYASMGFRESGYDRLIVRSPKLDAIQEELCES